MVSFPEAIKLFFKRYVDFQGRSSRAEYWWVQLLNFGVFFVFGFVFGFTGAAMSGGGEPSDATMGLMGIPLFIYMLVILVPSIALLVRRLHDIDKSGWLALGLLLGAIPVVGLLVGLVYIVLCCLPGTDGTNRYGPEPGGSAPV